MPMIIVVSTASAAVKLGGVYTRIVLGGLRFVRVRSSRLLQCGPEVLVRTCGKQIFGDIIPKWLYILTTAPFSWGRMQYTVSHRINPNVSGYRIAVFSTYEVQTVCAI